MARFVKLSVMAMVALTSCAAFCQLSDSARDQNSLPDAPSARASAKVENLQGNELRGFLTPISSVVKASGVWAASAFPNRFPAGKENFGLLVAEVPAKQQPTDFFDKYLYPSLLKRNLNYHSSSSSSFMGRATYAASRILVTRDETGRGRLNTSYVLAVLSSAAVHVASRPYWSRSNSPAAPFSDFGSTMGNDAGMNIFQEFRPGLEQLMKTHAPRFVTKIEERITH